MPVHLFWLAFESTFLFDLPIVLMKIIPYNGQACGSLEVVTLWQCLYDLMPFLFLL